MIETILLIIYVLIAITFVDIVWVFYIKYIATNNAKRAAFTAMILYAISASVIVTYTENKWYLIPACIGAYIGTYYAIRLQIYLKEKKKNDIQDNNNS